MIQNKIEISEINKIFSNKKEKLEYVKELYKEKNISLVCPTTNKEIDSVIINTWDYDVSNKIIRKMFEKTEKYIISKYSAESIKVMMEQWEKLCLGDFEWPFHPKGFDQYVQNINTNKSLTEEEKDIKVKNDIVKFRRIKKINTARNDFIEYLIVSNNDNVTPTLKHSRGVDFYINGYPFDQKVSRSVTKNFIIDFGDNWKEYAKSHPDIVAKYLYKYQDEERFGAESRLLIVYLDNDITEEDIYKCVAKTNFKEPIHINFEYEFVSKGKQEFNVDCYVVLLSKQE